MMTFRLYDRNGTTLLGLLPEPLSYQVGFEFNDVGAISIDYPSDGINASLLTELREIAIVDATGTERINGRFVITGINRDRVATEGTVTVTGKSVLWRLETALAYPTGGIASGEVSRYFDNNSAGYIVRTLFTEAQTRGALAGLTCSFTTTTDSNGVTWADAVTQEYPARISLLSVVRSLQDFGVFEVQTLGRTIKATGPDGIGSDLTVTANPVVLRYGQSLTEAPEQISAERLASVALIEGDNGLLVERSNSAAVTSFGRLETSLTASGIDDALVVNDLGDAYLANISNPVRQLTVGLAFFDGAPRPLDDFNVGDYVFTATSGGVERVRVRQITISMSNGIISATATLGDRIYENEIRNARQLNSISSGSVQLGNGGLVTTTPVIVPDSVAPAAPTGLTGTSVSYLDGNAIRSRVELSWTAPTLNSDGTALNDLRQYEIEFRQLTSDPWQYGGASAGTSFTVAGLTKNTQYRFRVTAVDSSNNRSAYSNVFIITTNSYVEIPSQPSAPVVTSRLGVLTVDWDGLNHIGGTMPIDLDYVAIYVSSAGANFTPGAGNYQGRINGPDLFHVTGLDYGTTYYVRLVAYNTSGVNSPYSTAGSATIQSLVNTDIIANTINGGKIVNGSITASDKIVANSITGAEIAALAITAGKIASNAITADKIEAGAITTIKIAAEAITAAKIAAGTITTDKLTAGTLTGFTINNGSGTFSVSSTGVMSAKSGDIGGFSIGTNFLSSTGFSLSSASGNATFNAVTANGTLSAAGGISLQGTFSGGANQFNNIGAYSGSSISLTSTLTASGNITANAELFAAGHQTATNAANGIVFGTGGRIARSTASSQRYKENIVDLVSVPELDPQKLYDLPVRAFSYKDDYLSETDDRYGALMPGFIAEEVDAIYPVAADYIDGPETWNDRMIVPALLALVQDLNARVAELEGGIA